MDVYKLDVLTDYGLDAIDHFFNGGDKYNPFNFNGNNLYRYDILNKVNSESVYIEISQELLNRDFEIINAVRKNDTETIQSICDWIDNLIKTNQ